MVMGDFTCLGVALPTSAPPMILVGGVTSSINGTTQGDEPGVTVEVFEGTNPTPTATTTSAPTGSPQVGAYSFMLATSNVPIDGYLHAMKASFIDTYLYPPVPLAADTTNASPFIVATSTLPLLETLTGKTQDPGKGIMAVIVADCANKPIQGATVSITPPPPDGSIIYTTPSGIPDTAATSTNTNGLVFILNVPVGSSVVDAQAGPNDLREHTVDVRADVLTETAVLP